MPAERWWNAPNLLTISRMVLAPFVVREILLRHPRPALWLIMVAALTDLLDGAVARATGADSSIGQLLDPVADKVLLSGVFVGLAWIGSVPIWLVAIVFGRDVLLILASLFAMLFTTYSNLKPNLLGKASTLFQILTAGVFIAANALGGGRAQTIGVALIWPTALLACLSGAVYAWRAASYFRRR